MKTLWQRGAETGQAVDPVRWGVQGEVIRSKELKLLKRKCKRRSMKTFLTVMSVSPWHPLLREVAQNPLLEAFEGALVTPWAEGRGLLGMALLLLRAGALPGLA